MNRQQIYESINGLSAMDVKSIVDENPSLFVHYFEAVIDKSGLVYFACPSHERKILELLNKQYKINTNDEPWRSALDYAYDYGYAVIWYNRVLGNLNKFQRNTINKLREYNILQGEK